MKRKKSRHKNREAGLLAMTAVAVFGVFAFCIWMTELGRNREDELITSEIQYCCLKETEEKPHEDETKETEEDVSKRISRDDILQLEVFNAEDEECELSSEGNDQTEDETVTEAGEEYVYFAILNEEGEICELNHELQRYIQDVLKGFGISEYWKTFYCQIYQESRFDPYAVSKHGDYGYCQLKGKYHSYFISEAGLPEETDLINDPLSNLYVGAWVMSENIKNCGTVDEAISRYYTGNDNFYSEYVNAVRQWESRLIEVEG